MVYIHVFLVFLGFFGFGFTRAGDSSSETSREIEAAAPQMQTQVISPENLLATADAAVDRQDYITAGNSYQTIVNGPYQPVFKVKAYLGLGKMYLNVGASQWVNWWSDAHTNFQQAAEWAHPNFQAFEAEALFYLGLLAHGGNGQDINSNKDQALTYYQNAAECARLSENWDIFFKSMLKRASIYRKKNELNRAIVEYTTIVEQTLALRPNYAEYYRKAHYELGIMYLQQKDYEHARMHLDKILHESAIDEFWGKAYWKLAGIAYDEQDYKLAREYYQKALDCQALVDAERQIIEAEYYAAFPDAQGGLS